MSEPVSDQVVAALCFLIDCVMDESMGDYFSHEQADRIRSIVFRNEIGHFEHENCAKCLRKKGEQK